MELWYTEKQTPNVGITCKTSKTLYTTKSEYQDIAVIDTLQFGRMLVIDGTVQTTIEDEYIYHEMISHVPLNTKTDAKKVLIVGGGDGGVVREVLKHKSVEKAYLVEIDQKVVDTGKKYLPEISCELENPRCEIHICDGIKFINEHKNEFDVIIIDSTDPVGPAVGLFKLDFYKSIFESLKDDGLFVAQTESPFYCKKLIHDVYSDISKVFPITKLYLASIPTYPSGLWTFTMGSKKYDPEKIAEVDVENMNTRYYNYGVHMASFKLPNFVSDIIK